MDETTMPKEIKILFVAGYGPIVQDDALSQRLYMETLGLPLTKEENNYCYTQTLGGSKYFALWPLSQVAESCFGNSAWPTDIPIPQACIEFEVEDIATATEAMKVKGYRLLVSARKEPWGQIVTRFLSPEGLLLGLCHTPWMRGEEKE
jgi:catechol 2,3-dioxygenase-like lactoylglutathione lyase family enzyme